MTGQRLFYYPYASFTNEQLPLLKVAALYFDKLIILDPGGASWATVGADHVARDAITLLKDPQKFFAGPMDFFSILLPGALLTFILMGDAGSVVLGGHYYNLTDAQAWATFLFATYLFGRLIFLLGSWLDDFYDCAQHYTLNTPNAMLAGCGHLLR